MGPEGLASLGLAYRPRADQSEGGGAVQPVAGDLPKSSSLLPTKFQKTPPPFCFSAGQTWFMGVLRQEVKDQSPSSCIWLSDIFCF